jgi:hypothetical protein
LERSSDGTEPRNTSISHSIGLISSVPAHAQTKSQSYLAGGIARAGDDDVARYLSGGVERVTLGGLLGGADIGALFGRTTVRPGYPRGQSYRQYALSAILGAHVPPGVTGRPLDPFVAGGVSVLTDPDCCGPGFLWNLGGGTNYWIGAHTGVRVDTKIYLGFGGQPIMIMARAGLAFR